MTDTLFQGVRLIDPANGLDQTGDLLVRDGSIIDLGAALGGAARRFGDLRRRHRVHRQPQRRECLRRGA